MLKKFFLKSLRKEFSQVFKDQIKKNRSNQFEQIGYP